MKNDWMVKNIEGLLLCDTRVKFLCTIAGEYEFVCPAPTIYYDPSTHGVSLIVDQLDSSLSFDFLIRHRGTGEALLIDLVSDELVDDARLQMRRTIAEMYINLKGYDWEYKVVAGSDIVLSDTELNLYTSYCWLRTEFSRKRWLTEFLMIAHYLKPLPFQSPSYSLLDFLIHDKLS